MSKYLSRVAVVVTILVLILGLVVPVAAASQPDTSVDRSKAYRPPAPWLEDEFMQQWQESIESEGNTKDTSPEEVTAAANQHMKTLPIGFGEKGGQNPRAYKRLLKNEAQAVAAGKSPKALGLGLTGTAQVLIIPVEFAGTQTFLEYTDAPACSITTTVTITGPMHNEIPNPAGTGDNSTFWMPDFDQPVYQHLFFDTGPTGGITTPVRSDLNAGAGIDLTGLTAANFYLEQSGGVYTLDGYVTPWVSVDASEGQFGANGDPVCGVPAGDETDVVISATVALNDYWLATYGEIFPWGDYDTDGDGVVDHLMIIHAGMDESGGGGAQGDYAIWAHSADVEPPFGLVVDPVNNIRVLPYTIVPENTDIGVYVHEYGHDIGLPDFYDQTYQTGNSTGFWELMSSGSWNGPLGGVEPAPMGLWDRYVLGWADPVFLDITSPEAELVLGQTSGPPEGTEDGVLINLPLRSDIVAEPHSGDYMWWSSNDKNYADSGILHTFDLTATTPLSFTFWADYLIEEDWDYFFFEVSTDDGATWTQLPGIDADTGVTMTTNADPNGRLNDMCEWRGGPDGCKLQNGLTGDSGDWIQLLFDLSDYAGQTVLVRLTYATDAGYLDWGIVVDDLSLDTPADNLYFDDVESGMDGWTKDDQQFDGTAPGAGWIVTDGTIYFPHYYLAEWRNYDGFDNGMKYCYNFVNYDTGTVERVPYDLPGMLLWYRDYRYTANQPYNWRYDDPSWGDKGMCMIVDAHPAPYRIEPHSTTAPFSNLSYRMQTKDAVFGLNSTQEFTLTNRYDLNVVNTFESRPAVNQFHDSQGYYPGLSYYPGWGNYWDGLGSSVVIPASDVYAARWYNPAWYDLGNPGPNNFGVHIVVEEQAADGSWGKVRVYNDNDTFLGKKEVSDLYPEPGDTITYTIILKDSAGSDLDSNWYTYTASLVDELPDEVAYVPGSFSFTGAGSAGIDAATGVITWAGTLGGHELAVPDAVIEFAVVTTDGMACNTAYVEIEDPGPMGYLPMWDAYELRTIPCSGQSIQGIKMVDTDTAKRGDVLMYTITLTNTGESEMGVALNDHTPGWTTYVASSVTGGATFVRDNPHDGPAVGNVVWSGTMMAGESKTFTFEVLVLDTAPLGTGIMNVAQVTTPEGAFDLTASTMVESFVEYLPLIIKNYP